MSDVDKKSNPAIEEKTKNHPCYSGGCQNARMHIPVAPACNISCNYCNRKFDCVNESRPGVTSEVLNPQQSLEKFLKVKSRLKNLKVVGIAGPGDALANFENTKRTLELIREVDPEVTFCLSTNGLMLPYHVTDLVNLGVTHVTVTLNTIDTEIGAKIYREVNFMGKKYTGEEAAEILLENQLKGIELLVASGIVCKINIVMIKNINDRHIEEVIKKVKELGVFISNIMPLIPASGSAFEYMPLTSNKELTELRKKCEVHLKQMYHCKQCRADAIGELGYDCSQEFREVKPAEEYSNLPILEETHRFAVASRDGKRIDEHFGHAKEFFIYELERGRVYLLEKRKVDLYCEGPEECGNEEEKLGNIINTIEDCDYILVSRIGHYPEGILKGKGKKVIQTLGYIDEEIHKAAIK